MAARRSNGARKKSGVLLPISALPSRGGIGDLGPEAFRFIDWLQVAGQRAWQILPLSIPDSTGSPYASLSSAAGNWLNISGEILQQQRLLPSDWKPRPTTKRVSYGKIWREKWRLIRESYAVFSDHGTVAQRRRYAKFELAEQRWLPDYCLFQAIKDRHRQQPWWTWEAQWRTPVEARRHVDRAMTHQMKLHAYAQWLWAEQWEAVHRYARRHGITIIGDMPFFLRTDCVNVWKRPKLFLLQRNGQPKVVAGGPPDDFSRTGQRWGNPQYNWAAMKRQRWQWWIERFRLLYKRVDVIRFDHFRGLVHTWHIPHHHQEAIDGYWVPTPGRELLRAVKRNVPQLNLIAEDLGPEGVGADALRKAFHAPTIRILLFGWNGMPHNPHALSALTTDTVLYTSNHDTNTTVGWWRTEAKAYERKHLRHFVGRLNDVAEQSIIAGYQSRADLVLTPVQDLLGLGASARYNRPGRRRGNWSWRLRPGELTTALAKTCHRRTHRYGR